MSQHSPSLAQASPQLPVVGSHVAPQGQWTGTQVHLTGSKAWHFGQGVGRAQIPSRQPPQHSFPQSPQLLLSLLVSTQLVPHSFWPVGQVGPFLPLLPLL